MSTTSNIIITLIALLHVYILVIEMFFWDKPLGLKAFGNTIEAATASKILAANQGLYNGFLAAGLVWGLWRGDTGVQTFFCVACWWQAFMAQPPLLKKFCLFKRCLPRLV